MKKTITIETAVIVSNILSRPETRLTKLPGADKIKVARASIALRPIREAYQVSEKEATERLRPDNWDELLDEEKRWDTLSDAAKSAHHEAVGAYQMEVSKCLEAERKKEVGVDIEPLSTDAVVAFADSNPDWSVSYVEIILDLFSE